MLTLTLALLLTYALAKLCHAMTMRIETDSDDHEEVARYELQFHYKRNKLREFLYAYVWSFQRLYRLIVDKWADKSQVALLQIRQALLLIRYGRGMIHG